MKDKELLEIIKKAAREKQKTLNLSVEDLKHLPAEIWQLTNLTTLDLSDNQLTSLPAEIGQLKNLTELSLSDNQLSLLPAEIWQLTNLTTLDLSDNQLTALPAEIGQLTNLTDLHLYDNQLSSLPAEIRQLANLKKLYLGINQLSSLPAEIGQLKNLTELYLFGNQLSSLPTEIGQLKNLTTLSLDDNKLISLPAEIWKLTNLIDLDFSVNKLSSLPTEIGQLTKLTVLSLRNNQLSSMPAEIGKLTNLTTLDLSDNQLSSLPAQIGQLHNLKSLSIQGNPLPESMLDAANRSLLELLAYLRSLAVKEEVENLYEAKLLLVGEGAVGKSSLLAAIKGEPFRYKRETTHGTEITTFNLPILCDKTSIRLNAWDFGGQIVYRVTNQFFFSQRSLYLLLWDPRQDAERCDVEGWIKRIRLRVGNGARILIVMTHAKTGERIGHIDTAVLKERYKEILVGFCDVDSGVLADGKTPALDGDTHEKFGIEALKYLIVEAAKKLPHFGTPFNLRWKSAKEETLALRGEPKNLAHIKFKDFREICRKHQLDDQDSLSLAGLMHDLGHVLYYGDHEALQEDMILQPEWVTKAIGFVLEDKETNHLHGVLEHKRLKQIWHDHGIADRECYDSVLYPFFLALMEHFDVSYRMEGGNADLVAQLVPDLRPTKELPWLSDSKSPKGKGQITLICQMDEIPPGIVPWMICRTHYYSTPDRRHWKNGMFLQMEGNDRDEALLELKEREFQISVCAEWPEYFMCILHLTLDKLISDRWPGLKKEFKVPCKGKKEDGSPCDGRFPLEAIRKFRAKGKSEYPCDKCILDFDIDDLLIGFPSPDIDVRQSLQRLEKGVAGFERMLQQSIMILLRGIGSESLEGPRLFSILPRELNKLDLKRIGMEGYILNVWCEMRGKQHPTCSIGSGGIGEFPFEAPKEWLAKAAPYLSIVSQVLLPISQIVGGIKLPAGNDLLDRFDLITGAVETLIEKNRASHEMSAEPNEIYKQPAEGAALREIRTLVNDLAKKKGCDPWGGLRRVPTPTGDYLWLCPEHCRIYEPSQLKLDSVASSDAQE